MKCRLGMKIGFALVFAGVILLFFLYGHIVILGAFAFVMGFTMIATSTVAMAWQSMKTADKKKSRTYGE